jgi:hopanoid biosynthesis associated RND transporter like protein HpnN
MQQRLIEIIYALTTRHRPWVLAIVGLVTIAAALASSKVTLSTSQRGLLPAKNPVQIDYQRFVDEFGAADSLIVVLDGEQSILAPAADAIAAELSAQAKWVSSVFYHFDLSLFFDHAPLYAPLDALKKAQAMIEANRRSLARLGEVHDLAALLRAIEAQLRGRSAQIDPRTAGLMLDGLTELMHSWRDALTNPAPPSLDVVRRLMAQAGERNAIARSGGYLCSNDGKLFFLFVQPRQADDELKFLAPFLQAMRTAADRVIERHADWHGRIKVAFTGLPAHVYTETETVFTDVGHGIVLAILLVIIVVLVGFRTWRKVTIALIPMIVGMLVGLGIVALVVGRIHLISAAFFAVMFGMSIDFGIYLVRRAEEELGKGKSLAEAVRIAMLKTGPGVLTGGLTNCAAFFAITLSDFSGFAELGLTAGIGIFACLAAVFVLFPILTLWLGLEPKKPNLARVVGISRKPSAKAAKMAFIALVAAAGIISIYVAPRIRFDYNALDLLPRNTESTIYQLRMQQESDFQVTTAMVVADSLPELRRMVTQLRGKPEVARVEFLGDLIPDDQDAKLAVMAEIQKDAGNLEVQYQPGPLDLAAIKKNLEAIAQGLDRAQEDAFDAGQAELTEHLEGALATIKELQKALTTLPAAIASTRTSQFEQALFAGLRQITDLAHKWMSSKRINESGLSPEVLSRFKSKAGHYVAYVSPKNSIWDIARLDEFVAAVKTVTPHVTGFPITHQVYTRMVVRGFVQAMLYALLAVVALLYLDFKNARSTLLALLPLASGFLLLQLVLWVLHLEHNYASIAAFPVLLGYGVAYGVNIVHRWLESPGKTAFVSAYTIGKGVLLSAATALAGVASIMFARHGGVSAFGIALFAGISLCLFLATLILPAVIDLFFVRNGEPYDS